MKHLLAAICLVQLTANAAFALSCQRPSVEASYLRHSEAKERYILVTGQLSQKQNVVLGPQIDGTKGERAENFTATFTGHQATRAGFDRPLEATVAVSARCAGPWCGMVDVDTPMLTFLQVTPYGHQLSVGPCGGAVFYNPSQDQNDRVLQCLRGGVCAPKTR